MLVAAYTLAHNEHVAIDLITSKFSVRKQAAINVVTYLLFFFPFTAIVFVKGIKFAKASWEISEKAWGVCNFPLYQFKTVIPVAALLLLFQGLVVFVRHVNTLIRGEER